MLFIYMVHYYQKTATLGFTFCKIHLINSILNTKKQLSTKL